MGKVDSQTTTPLMITVEIGRPARAMGVRPVNRSSEGTLQTSGDARLPAGAPAYWRRQQFDNVPTAFAGVGRRLEKGKPVDAYQQIGKAIAIPFNPDARQALVDRF